MSEAFRQIKEACVGRCGEILGLDLDKLSRSGGPCPICSQDSSDDRFWAPKDANDNGRIGCRKCMDKPTTGDIIDSYRWLHRMGSQFDAAKAIADYLGLNVFDKLSNGFDRPRTDIMADVARLKKITVDSMRVYGATVENRRSNYGNRFQVVRFPMYDRNGSPISWFDLGTFGDWLKGKSAYNRPMGMFLPRTKKPDSGRVCVVEGVKDASALHAMGYYAVGLPTCELSINFVHFFRGLDVTIVPDLDEPGMNGARRAARRLYGIASSVAIARMPGEIKKKGGCDVRDVRDAVGEQAVRDAIDQAAQWTLESESEPESIADISNAFDQIPPKLHPMLEDAIEWVQDWRIECVTGGEFFFRIYSDKFENIESECLEATAEDLKSFPKFDLLLTKRCKLSLKLTWSDVWPAVARILISRAVNVQGEAERDMSRRVAGIVYSYICDRDPIELDTYIAGKQDNSNNGQYYGILFEVAGDSQNYYLDFNQLSKIIKLDLSEYKDIHLIECLRNCKIESRRVDRPKYGFRRKFRFLTELDVARLGEYSGIVGTESEIREAMNWREGPSEGDIVRFTMAESTPVPESDSDVSFNFDNF